jgi:PAS domain S-box-containing protein
MNASMPGAEGNAGFHNRLQNWSAHFISTALLICLLVLAGWKFNISILKSPLTHEVLMNPVTALSLSMLAIATLLLYYQRSRTRIARAVGHCLLLMVMSISTWKLLNSIGIIDKPVDYWLFYPAMQAEIQAGKHCHMTPVTVACLFLISLALWLLPVKTRSGWVPAQPIALMVIAITFFSFLSHLYYIQAFYGIFDYIPMPLYSAIAFTLLALSVFSATAGHGLMDIFSGTHAGTMMARFVVPAVIIVPALFGLLRLYGHWRGIFTTEFGVAILVLSIIIFFLALTWYTARLLNTRDTEKEITTADLLQTRAKTQYQAQLLQNISDAVISTDVDFKIVSWNKAAEELYGWREEEVLGKTIGDLLKPVYEKESREEILSAYFKNNYWKGEVFHHTRKGERLSILVSTTVMKQDNVNTGTVAVIRDITQRKRAEKNFRDLLDAAPDATVIVDAR